MPVYNVPTNSDIPIIVGEKLYISKNTFDGETVFNGNITTTGDLNIEGDAFFSGGEFNFQGNSIFNAPLNITSEIELNANPGNSDQVMTSQGPGKPPIWKTLQMPDLTNLVTTDTDQEIKGSKRFEIEPDGDANIIKPFDIIRDGAGVFTVTHSDEVARIMIDGGADGDVSLYFGQDCGTDGQVLTSHGEGATPSWETPESGGLFEIPYDLTKLQSGSAGVDFIINNIEKIKKGAYFKWLSTTNVVITSVNSKNSTIELVFNAETISNSDHYIQYNLMINKNNKTVGYYNFDIDGADLEDDPQLLICKFVGATATFTPSGFKATAANNGRVVGVQNGQFKLVDGGATITNITVTKVS